MNKLDPNVQSKALKLLAYSSFSKAENFELNSDNVDFINRNSEIFEYIEKISQEKVLNSEPQIFNLLREISNGGIVTNEVLNYLLSISKQYAMLIQKHDSYGLPVKLTYGSVRFMIYSDFATFEEFKRFNEGLLAAYQNLGEAKDKVSRLNKFIKNNIQTEEGRKIIKQVMTRGILQEKEQRTLLMIKKQ